jgi:hypothetical protein
MSYLQSKHFLNSEKSNCEPTVNVSYIEKDKKGDLASPEYWGPSLWLVCHVGANNYPKNPSKITIDKMKKFIEGLPYILPCENCFEHASSYVDSIKNNLDEICSSRDNLFKSFNDFHNFVNKRTNKKIIPLEAAKDMYTNGKCKIIKYN